MSERRMTVEQTAAILELSERIVRLEKRVAELETKRDNR